MPVLPVLAHSPWSEFAMPGTGTTSQRTKDAMDSETILMAKELAIFLYFRHQAAVLCFAVLELLRQAVGFLPGLFDLIHQTLGPDDVILVALRPCGPRDVILVAPPCRNGPWDVILVPLFPVVLFHPLLLNCSVDGFCG